jgi:uncharacterized protein (TIGR03435 family)
MLAGGRGFTATNVTARQLILSAYRVRGLQVIGGPAWIDSDRFDIDARTPENGPFDQVLLMLRGLLAERFKLVIHNETKEQPIYALLLARADGKLGPQMKPSTLDCSTPGSPARAARAGADAPPPQQSVQVSSCGMNTETNSASGVMRGGGRSLPDLAAALANFVAERMVIDRTGLAGTFDFELRWTPENLRSVSPDPAADAPSIFAALQEQLGLKLESQRGPVEFLVIDSVQQPPPN